MPHPGEPPELVRVLIEGISFEVPSGELLLACVQYIVRDEAPVLGRFCWSNECGNCEMSVRRKEDLFPSRARGCQTPAEADMEISELGPELRYWLHRRLT